MNPDTWATALHFARARWGGPPRHRSALEAHQQRALQRFLRETLPRAPQYRQLRVRRLEELPVMDRTDMMRGFDQRNTRGIGLEQAMALGLRAESTRDFSATLGDVTVGLSSGTSGNRGVFLVSARERRRWAGVLMARALPAHLLVRLLSPWRPPVRVAFFLRANSVLYQTLASRRVHFAWFDLLAGVEAALPRLATLQPDMLVGPPQLLRALAASAGRGELSIRPSHIISVAEVLESEDAYAVEQAFGCRPHQIYQAAEGFLGYTCEQGNVHLNECHVHVEPEWLDAESRRFQPIITDFTRTTQLVVRYRLNDVLRVAERPCGCGTPELTLAAIEGRSDEVLWLPAIDGHHAVPVFPDWVRRCMFLAGPVVQEFEVVQQGMSWRVGLRSPDPREAGARVAQALRESCAHLGVRCPDLEFGPWRAQALHAKRRRVRLAQTPPGLACTF